MVPDNSQPLADTEHFLFECPHWSCERAALERSIGAENLTLEKIFQHVPAIASYICKTIFYRDEETASDLLNETNATTGDTERQIDPGTGCDTAPVPNEDMQDIDLL